MNKTQLVLTKYYLKIYRAEFSEIREHILPNKQKVEIITYTGHKNLFPWKAQLTLLGTIIAEKRMFINYSKNFQNYTVAHEFGHRSSSNIIFLFLLLEVFSLLFIVKIIASWLILSIQSIIFPIGFLMSSSSFLFLIGLLFIWRSEMQADFYAIRVVGLGNVIKAIEEGKGKGKEKRPVVKKILNGLTHPPFRLTFYLFNKLKG